jgi:hypothetical protein
MNPVRSHLTPDPYVWKWSSAIVEIDFLFFIPQGGAEKSKNEFREGTYAPYGVLGTDSFLESLELSLMRAVKRRKAGRKKNVDE